MIFKGIFRDHSCDNALNYFFTNIYNKKTLHFQKPPFVFNEEGKGFFKTPLLSFQTLGLPLSTTWTLALPVQQHFSGYYTGLWTPHFELFTAILMNWDTTISNLFYKAILPSLFVTVVFGFFAWFPSWGRIIKIEFKPRKAWKEPEKGGSQVWERTHARPEKHVKRRCNDAWRV